MLAALKEAPVPVLTPAATSQTPTLTATSNTPAVGLLVAGAGEIAPASLNTLADPQQWLGFRAMTDSQLDELSKAIVKQVRLRGPFTSLSDFVNRRPGTNLELAVSGALQSALDDADVSINAAYRSGNRSLSVADAKAQGFEFPEAAAGAKSAGAPGYVKQGDLLTPLGPLIAVRGDTFTIRSYGEARDPANIVTARAYCEAVVQRVPDYVDASNGASDYEHDASVPYVPPAKKLTDLNKLFGRQFQVISFRYLQPGEI